MPRKKKDAENSESLDSSPNGEPVLTIDAPDSHYGFELKVPEVTATNWRKKIKPEFIVFNTQYKDAIEKQYGKPIGELSVEEVEDKYLLILLAGFKEVAKLRGFKSVTYPFVSASRDFVSVYCEIEWEDNEFGKSFKLGDGADTHADNTDGFGQKFLTAIAFNRAFVRAVRSSLDIHVVGKDEVSSAVKIDNSFSSTSPTGPKAVLKSKIDKKGISIEKFGEWWAKSQNLEEAKDWKSIEDIPDEYVWTILGILKKREEEKKSRG